MACCLMLFYHNWGHMARGSFTKIVLNTIHCKEFRNDTFLNIIPPYHTTGCNNGVSCLNEMPDQQSTLTIKILNILCLWWKQPRQHLWYMEGQSRISHKTFERWAYKELNQSKHLKVSDVSIDVVKTLCYCRRCSNYIFIHGLTPGLDVLGKDNSKTKREPKFCYLVWLNLTV